MHVQKPGNDALGDTRLQGGVADGEFLPRSGLSSMSGDSRLHTRSESLAGPGHACGRGGCGCRRYGLRLGRVLGRIVDCRCRSVVANLAMFVDTEVRRRRFIWMVGRSYCGLMLTLTRILGVMRMRYLVLLTMH